MSGRFGSPFGDYPAMGAVVAHETGFASKLPPYVAVPSASEYGGTGYLGSQFGPWGTVIGAGAGALFGALRGIGGPSEAEVEGRGGALVGIYRQLKLPIYFLGLGEQPDDLQPFTVDHYVRAVFGLGDERAPDS